MSDLEKSVRVMTITRRRLKHDLSAVEEAEHRRIKAALFPLMQASKESFCRQMSSDAWTENLESCPTNKISRTNAWLLEAKSIIEEQSDIQGIEMLRVDSKIIE